MKQWIFAACCLLTLAGCSSDYIINTTDGQMINTQGKPELDDETGLLQYEDADGNEQQIPQAQVKGLIER